MTHRKDGLWQEVVIIDGKRKYFYGKTKAAVMKKLREWQEGNERGELFREVVLDWREEHWETLVHSTARSYEPSIKRAIAQFPSQSIKEITAAQIEAHIRELAAQKYSKKTVTRQLNVYNMVFNYAIRNGMIQYNPCAAVRVPAGLPVKNRELPSDADFETVRNSEWLLPFFLLYSGCRRGEALAICYEDIDIENKVIHINKAVGYQGNRPYIKHTKTDAGRRDIILLDILAERIPKGKKGLVFPNKKGELYTETEIVRTWAAWQQENQTTVTAHQLRHGYATILFDAGLDAKDAQYLLGHTTIAMTQDVYTHIRQQRQKITAEKLNFYVNNV